MSNCDNYRLLFTGVLDEINELISDPWTSDRLGFDKRLNEHSVASTGTQSLGMGCRDFYYRIVVSPRSTILLEGIGNGHTCGREVSDGVNYTHYLNRITLYYDGMPINLLYRWNVFDDIEREIMKAYGRLMYIIGAMRHTPVTNKDKEVRV